MNGENNKAVKQLKKYTRPKLTKYERLQDLTHGDSVPGNGPIETCAPFDPQCTNYNPAVV